MDSEAKTISVISISIALAFVALCFFGKGCNDADDQLHKALVEKGCAYFGDNKFDCRTIQSR